MSNLQRFLQTEKASLFAIDEAPPMAANITSSVLRFILSCCRLLVCLYEKTASFYKVFTTVHANTLKMIWQNPQRSIAEFVSD